MIILSSGVSNYIILEGKRYSYFGGNNYLDLANHPALKAAAAEAIEKYGISFSASRQTTGTSEIHIELERLLSEFKNKKDSVVFASGYLGNSILLHTLRNRYSAVFIDEMSHPSITDGIPADIEKVLHFEHCNPDHLESLLGRNRKYRPLIITDGIFALTGEIAPLDNIYPLVHRYNGTLLADDSHATGVLGDHGRGTPDFFHLDGAADIFQSETMSKALGAYGGFISSDIAIIQTIRKESHVYLSSTSLPPPVVAAACASVKIVTGQSVLRTVLNENISKIKNEVKRLDFNTLSDPTPIVPLLFSSCENARGLSDFLKENGIIVPFITYPVRMNKFLVRITVSAGHTNDQIDELMFYLKKWKDSHESN
jgi:7-keto-8-aminopelargonate synthetase-like enzyme